MSQAVLIVGMQLGILLLLDNEMLPREQMLTEPTPQRPADLELKQEIVIRAAPEPLHRPGLPTWAEIRALNRDPRNAPRLSASNVRRLSRRIHRPSRHKTF